MSHGSQARSRRTVSDWLVQPLESRTLLSQAGAAATAPAQAEVGSIAGQVSTTTILQASTQAAARRPTVTLTATVTAPEHQPSREHGGGAILRHPRPLTRPWASLSPTVGGWRR